jgi:hypothetical protein
VAFSAVFDGVFGGLGGMRMVRRLQVDSCLLGGLSICTGAGEVAIMGSLSNTLGDL